ncbi:MAG: glycosyltransferase family 39 protein [Xenococcaceae cyanobacterium MO_234.B1]|nr:glycosyltransferase family 39 protein [Xenococcaceae cyanobacterium MO_234.B1]
MGSKQDNFWLHWCLLLLWIAVGTGLRLTNLELKPPWADEWATLVFSLGNSFKTIPLEQIISLDTLLQPLQLDKGTEPQDVVTYLMRESTHPPVYFVLTHLWLKLFSQEGLVSLGLARSLSAWLGVLGIPGIFALGKLITGSRTVGQVAAALMAVSPYGIYLGQETRHYTLAILWVMASLACLVIAIKCLAVRKSPAIALIIIWVIVNSLGVATHYFFALTLVTEILVLLGFYGRESKQEKSWYSALFTQRWRRISWAILGTIAGCLIWVWTWLHIPDNQLTDWTGHGDPWGKDFFEPLGRLVAWISTMILLLPVEGTSLGITTASVIVIFLVLLGLLIAVWKYWHQTENLVELNLTKQVIGTYILSALLLVLAFAYLGDHDLTLAARFQFFYFPSILILVASVLSYFWHQSNKTKSPFLGKNLVVIILLLGLCGGLTVINNYGYQKPDRPDLVASGIKEAQSVNPEVPVLVAIVHKTHEQTGEMMGIAWEWYNQKSTDKYNPPQFLLLHKEGDETAFKVTEALNNNVDKLPRPLDVWVINFSASTDLDEINCFPDEKFKLKSPGYRHRLYHCS